jgi:hypothetical protein
LNFTINLKMFRLVKKRRLYKSFPQRKTSSKLGLSPSQFPKRKRGIIPITKNDNISTVAIFDFDFSNPVKKSGQAKTSLFRKFEKWFDLRFGWFFVNGNKVESWNKKLDEKYNDK